MRLLTAFILACLPFGFVSNFDPETLYMRSTFVVQGTSNAHEWALEAEVADLDVIVYVENEMIKVDRFKGKVPVAELKNDNSLMTQDAYLALKGYEFPNIEFELTKINSVNEITGEILGKVYLSIAGETKMVDIVVKSELVSEEFVRLSGWKGLKMTEFNVQPPNFFSGAIQAKDDIVIWFEMYVPVSVKPDARASIH